MKKNITYSIIAIIALVSILAGVLFAFTWNKKTNWDEKFDTKETKAFDLSIFSKEIDSLLPNKKINKYDTELDTYINPEINPSLHEQTIIVIKPTVYLYYDTLIDYLEKGNDVFIFSNHVFIESQTTTFLNIEPNISLKFKDARLKPFKTNLPYQININSIDLSASYTTEILGTANGKNIFVRYKVGNGNLYIHNIPHVFTNHYFVNNNSTYPSAVLSYIKQNEITLLSNNFDRYKNYQKNNEKPYAKNNDPGLLSFVLSNKYLKSAWYLFLISCFIFILFRAKRTQRVIPILPENKNKTLEFIQTISSIYYNEKNNLALVKKMNHQFLEKVEKLYNIKTENLDENFIKKLASVSNTDIKIVEQAVAKIKLYNYSALQPNRTAINEHYINLKKIIA